MTTGELLEMVRDLNHRREPYALVTVVRAIAPTSAYIGAQAIVLADGTLHGWIGGGCAQGVVIGAARAAIEAGEPKLVRIANDRVQLGDDIEQHSMSCASNGSVELFIHPYGVGPALCVLGSTPAADEARFFVDRLGIRLVETVAEASVVLIATQGQGDERALDSALRSPAAHVLMIASRRKARTLRELMSARGIGEAQLARLQAPAGQDAGAQTPAEIALVAVAAALGFLRHRERATTSDVRTPHGTNGTARPSVDSSTKFLNPVCGKEVDIIHPKHTEEHEGTSYYFCCDGCWNTFRGDPAKYASIHQDTQRST